MATAVQKGWQNPRRGTPHNALLAEPLVVQARAGRLDEAQARESAARDPDLVALTQLALARRIAALQRTAAGTSPTLATPSGVIPVWAAGWTR